MEKQARKVALSVAGTDASGRAGLTADLRVFGAFGLHGACVVSAVTCQPVSGPLSSWQVPAKAFKAQLDTALRDQDVGAIKAGMLGAAEAVTVLCEALERHPDIPFVLDPVFATSRGDALLEPAALAVLRAELLPRTTVLTPNLPEAAGLLGEARPEDASSWGRARREEAAAALLDLGPAAIYLTGGHAAGGDVEDLLWTAGSSTWFVRERSASRHLRGTGCLLSAALCSGLAQGTGLEAASAQAGAFVGAAIRGAGSVGDGAGCPQVPATWPSPARTDG